MDEKDRLQMRINRAVRFCRVQLARPDEELEREVSLDPAETVRQQRELIEHVVALLEGAEK